MDMGMGDDSPESCKISASVPSKMLWNWYTVDACFLSSSWHIQSSGMFAASCIGIVVLVISVEFMRRLGQEYDEFIVRQWRRQAVVASDLGIREARESATSSKAILFRATPLQQLLRAIIHAITFGAAYVTMLLATHPNGYITSLMPAKAFIGVSKAAALIKAF